MARPKMILLDEPSMGLSPLLVKEVFSTVFSAIDPIILNDIALPALRERFLASGGRVMAHAPLGDIDSTSEYATDLLFGEDTQIVVKPQDAVVLALHPKQLCDAVPDIGFAPAPARRQTMVFEVRRQFAEPRGLFTSDDLVRLWRCHNLIRQFRFT